MVGRCHGSCLQDIELRRNDPAFLDALGAQRIPDPTTAGECCRRFDAHKIKLLQDIFDDTRIQKHVGIHVDCPEEHKHTPSCFLYGFHDFRRAFATVNAPHMKAEVLQRLMRHKRYTTTLGYINLASQLEEAVAKMPVPKVLQKEEQKPDPPKEPTT